MVWRVIRIKECPMDEHFIIKSALGIPSPATSITIPFKANETAPNFCLARWTLPLSMLVRHVAVCDRTIRHNRWWRRVFAVLHLPKVLCAAVRRSRKCRSATQIRD